MQKLHLALDVYRGLAGIAVIRKEVAKKVISMLLHPFPNIRVAAAQTLFIVTNGNANVKALDWGQTLRALKPTVEELRAQVDYL